MPFFHLFRYKNGKNRTKVLLFFELRKYFVTFFQYLYISRSKMPENKRKTQQNKSIRLALILTHAIYLRYVRARDKPHDGILASALQFLS